MLFFARRSSEAAASRRIRASAHFRPAVDGLESRLVLSHAAAPAAAAIAPAQVNNLLTINDINLTDLQVTGADQLLATLDVTGTLAGRPFTLPNVQVPINLSQTGSTADGCPILHLEVGPINLNLLGLRVDLDDCSGGPVTVDITAVPGAGNLLGNLLCGITNALPGNLLGSLTDLTAAQQGALTEALTGLLNGAGGQAGLLDSLLGGAGNVTGSQSNGPRTTSILDLELEQGLDLNLLGLEVTTSPICLNVYAQRGPGNLLGNLLSNITRIFDRTGRIPRGLLNNLGRALDRIPSLV